MKTIKILSSAILIAFTISLMSFNKGGYFNIYVENKCSKDVKLNTRADGSSSETTIAAGKKEQRSVKEGYELKVDGKLIKKIEASDEGDVIVICD